MDVVESQEGSSPPNTESQILEALKGRSESAETPPEKSEDERNDATEEVLGESEEESSEDETVESGEQAEEAEESEEEESEEDVLSQSDSTDDSSDDDLIDIIDNLSPEGLETFRKRINSRAMDRIATLHREKKEAEEKLAEAIAGKGTAETPKMVITAEDSHKPFSKCSTGAELTAEVKQYKTVSKELDRALRKADRQALEDDETIDVTTNGKTWQMTVQEARSRLDLAESALEDDAPQRANHIAQQQQNEARVSERFKWHAKKDTTEVKNFGILDEAVGQYLRKLPNGTFILSALAEWATKEQQSSEGIEKTKKDTLKRKVAKIAGSAKAPKGKSTRVKTESSKIQQEIDAAQKRLGKSGSGRDVAKILKLRAKLRG